MLGRVGAAQFGRGPMKRHCGTQPKAVGQNPPALEATILTHSGLPLQNNFPCLCQMVNAGG